MRGRGASLANGKAHMSHNAPNLEHEVENMMKLVLAAVAALTLLAAGAPAQAEDSKDPIKLTLHDWTGQLITTQLMGEALKKAGVNVEYVQADYIAQFAG